MTKPKRMSEILASSSEKDRDSRIASTPPYSSDGPTLPTIGQTDDQNVELLEPSALENATLPQAGNKRKTEEQTAVAQNKKTKPQPSPSIDPALYYPWTLLPPGLLNLLESQHRLRKTQNIIPVVFSKNQNVKSGINRLKTYLGYDKDSASAIELPDALKLEDCTIAVSAQGEATSKLISIVDMIKRLVDPSGEGGGEDPKFHKTAQRWWLYTMLTNVETERKLYSRNAKTWNEEARKNTIHDLEEGSKSATSGDANDLGNKKEQDPEEANHKRRVPVLTVWITRKQIPAFRDAFGEYSFMTVMTQGWGPKRMDPLPGSYDSFLEYGRIAPPLPGLQSGRAFNH